VNKDYQKKRKEIIPAGANSRECIDESWRTMLPSPRSQLGEGCSSIYSQLLHSRLASSRPRRVGLIVDDWQTSSRAHVQAGVELLLHVQAYTVCEQTALDTTGQVWLDSQQVPRQLNSSQPRLSKMFLRLWNTVALCLLSVYKRRMKSRVRYDIRWSFHPTPRTQRRNATPLRAAFLRKYTQIAKTQA